MIVRALNQAGDWTFGKGRNNYYKNRDALKQNLSTRLKQFLGDSFWAVSDGIDWFTFLGGKDQTGLQLAINSMILNTEGVTGLLSIDYSYDPATRNFRATYAVSTIYGVIADDFIFDPGGTF